jgi:hypothetical protein
MSGPTLPTKTAKNLRVPGGTKMPDGYQSLIVCNTDPTISFYEKSIKPPGYDGGEMIDTTTMLNLVLRTFSTRKLITLTPIGGSAGYDPIVYTDIRSVLNLVLSWTIWFPNNGALVIWAGLNKFEPQELQEGTFPEAQFTLSPTGADNNDVECEPQYWTPGGTQIAA